MNDTITKAPADGTMRHRVYEAVLDMNSNGLTANRETVAAKLNLKPRQVAEAFDDLVNHGRLTKIGRGKVEVLDHFTARACSVTTLPTGLIKMEAGDEMMYLSPREAMFFAQMLAGRMLGVIPRVSTEEKG